MTLIEVVAVIGVLGLLAALILPALAKSNHRPGRINCVSNLKQIGLAFRMWAEDHDNQMPWQVSREKDGTLQLVADGSALPHFLAISNELNTPKILTCSSDVARSRAIMWPELTQTKHLSYFVGVDATETRPQTLLSGDRNLSVNDQIHSGLVTFSQSAPVRWAPGLHAPAGNVAFADGSVGQLSETATRTQLRKETNAPIRLVFP